MSTNPLLPMLPELRAEAQQQGTRVIRGWMAEHPFASFVIFLLFSGNISLLALLKKASEAAENFVSPIAKKSALVVFDEKFNERVAPVVKDVETLRAAHTKDLESIRAANEAEHVENASQHDDIIWLKAIVQNRTNTYERVRVLETKVSEFDQWRLGLRENP